MIIFILVREWEWRFIPPQSIDFGLLILPKTGLDLKVAEQRFE